MREPQGISVEGRAGVQHRLNGFQAAMVDVAAVLALKRDADALRAAEWHHHALAGLRRLITQLVGQQVVEDATQWREKRDADDVHGLAGW